MGASVLSFQAGAQANPVVAWAKTATAETVRGNTYAASFATGSPDAKGCDSANGQWASKGRNEVSSITLSYSKPSVPTLINVFQNNAINAISKIEVSANGTNWTTVYTGDTTKAVAGSCMKTKGYDDVLMAPVSPNFTTVISKVRVTVDQTTMGWAEIDAVQVLGKTAQTIPKFITHHPRFGDTLRLPERTSGSLKIIWTTSTPNNCSIRAGILMMHNDGNGICAIEGTNAGNGSFAAVVVNYHWFI
jgi:hypothetical protein